MLTWLHICVHTFNAVNWVKDTRSIHFNDIVVVVVTIARKLEQTFKLSSPKLDIVFYCLLKIASFKVWIFFWTKFFCCGVNEYKQRFVHTRLKRRPFISYIRKLAPCILSLWFVCMVIFLPQSVYVKCHSFVRQNHNFVKSSNCKSDNISLGKLRRN